MFPGPALGRSLANVDGVTGWVVAFADATGMAGHAPATITATAIPARQIMAEFYQEPQRLVRLHLWRLCSLWTPACPQIDRCYAHATLKNILFPAL
jgi:hypothetical protein